MPTGLLKLTVNAVTADETQEFAGGTGTAEDPFLIATADHLNNVRNYLNANFKMIADITCDDFANTGDYFVDLVSGFDPIGASYSAFTGSFDGNGYCIKNLHLIGNYDDTGLFGYNRGTIKNLSVEGVSIKNSATYTGGIVGYNDGTVSNCHNSGEIVLPYFSTVGGVAGKNNGTITDCSNTGKISILDGDHSGSSIGGIVGENRGTITNCHNIGNIFLSETYNDGSSNYIRYDYAGGIAGKNNGTITRCYNRGVVSLLTYGMYLYACSGGVAGINGDKGTIKNCYNTGEVSSYSTYVACAGGIVGRNTEWSYSADVIDCYNIGPVSSESTFCDSLTGLPYAFAGGIAGECDRYATATNCYYLDNVSKGAGRGSDYATKCTSYQLKLKSTFKNFDFVTVWIVGGHNHNSEYKYPQFQLVENVDYTLEYTFNNDVHWTKCNICEMRIGTSSDHIYDSCEDSQCNICGYERILDVHRKAVDDATAVQIDNTSASPFVLKNGVYNSTNKSIPSTSTFSIKATKDCILVIDYYTSTRKDIDYLIIKHNNTTMRSASGATSWSTITLVLEAGDVVDIKYSKPSSYTSGVDKGDDAVYFKLQCVRMLPAEDFLPTCESVVCDICGVEVKPATGHSYDNACDAECNACGKIRSVPAHVYDNTCDTECNICGHTRTITHNYEWIIDAENTCGIDGRKHEECTICHTTQNVGTVIPATGNHTYDNACDTTCNVCGYVHAVSDHVFDNDCDSACNECGFARDRDHLYDMECDVTCNKCGATRVVPHFYDDESDSLCNLCGHNRAKASGKTGDCDWHVIDTTLYITGSGAMGDYNTYSTLPWGKTITEVVIQDGVTTIGSYAFYYCSKLTSVTISDSVISIGDYAFSNCTNIDNLIIEEGITTIGKYAFNYCSKLSTIRIPDSVTSIGEYAFRYCSGLTSATIEEGLAQIASRTFYGCSQLSSITIPSSITAVGTDAFYGCSALSSVYITDLKAWCGIDFADYDDNPLYRADNLYLNGEKVTELNIPSGTTTIKKYAFAYFDGFTAVRIPGSVITIGSYAFAYCDNLKTVTLESGKMQIGSYTFYKCTNLTSVAMGTDMEAIGSYAFAGCSSLTSVMIPGSVETIGDHAFYECTSLASLTIQNGVNTISSYAFAYCKGIISVVIPGSVTSVGDYAFSYCNNLKVAIIGDGITQIAPDLFWESSNLTDVAIGKSVKQVGATAFYSCRKLKDVWYSGVSQSDISISYSNTPLTDATWHCNVDVVGEHIYDSVCDVFCNICDDMRTVPHVYDNACDTICNACGTTRTVVEHSYDNNCDAICNICKFVRSVPDHNYELNEKHTCNICRYSKIPDIPAVESKTHNSVTLVPMNGFEYSKDGITWQVNNVFTNLSPDTEYTFYQRVKGSDVALASETSVGVLIKTDMESTYTIAFRNWDGTVISSKIYHYGDKVTVPSNPTRVADNTYIYTFKGWDKTVVNCAGDATYTAQYTATYKNYTITFKNWDGAVLSSKTYHWGDKVTAPANPTRPNDGKNAYTFTGWDKTVVSCSGNATYTAVYSAKSLVPNTITSSTHTVSGGIVSKIGVGTTVDTLVKNLNESNYVKVYSGATEAPKTALIGTGMEVKLTDGNIVGATATIIVTGDINGDGKISVTDYVQMQAHLLNKTPLQGAAAKAADTSGDGKISVTDYVQIQAHILGKSAVQPRSIIVAVPTSAAASASCSAAPAQDPVVTTVSYVSVDAIIPDKRNLITV